MARGQRHDDDEGSDYSIELGGRPSVPAPTMELETADLKEMSLSGEALAKPNLVIQTADGKKIELQPGWSQGAPPKAAADGGTPSIIVDAELAPEPANARRTAPKQRTRTEPASGSGVWIVVLVYLAAGAALGLAIYERFVL